MSRTKKSKKSEKSDFHINPGGVPENLPNEQLVEDLLKANFAKSAELYGFQHLETGSLEYLETLKSEGEITKQIYVIENAAADKDDVTDEVEEGIRALHFDLTVPFARYTAQNEGKLHFPFRRFQIQKSWRGEKQQAGRFREFYQADMDIVAQSVLPAYYDAEVASAMIRTMSSFNIGAITMHIGNRKLLDGLLASCDIDMSVPVLQAIDRIPKVGRESVTSDMVNEMNFDEANVNKLLDFVTEVYAEEDMIPFIQSIEPTNDKTREGVKTMLAVLEELPAKDDRPNVKLVINLSIARGLDYYTGSVFESFLDGLERYGSICSGGQYEDLASRFTSRKLPGVGLSLGLSRLLWIIKQNKLMDFSQHTKTQVGLLLLHEDKRRATNALATRLRNEGINVEINQRTKLGYQQQIARFSDKGIPHAAICENDGSYKLIDLNIDDPEDAKTVHANFDDLRTQLGY